MFAFSRSPVALKPKLSFVFDIRRGNLQAHLVYKAVIEMSENRIAATSRLKAFNEGRIQSYYDVINTSK